MNFLQSQARCLWYIMKITTWNVNSIRARLESVIRWLKENRPDVCCFQELKCQNDQFPASELETLGYNSIVYGQKARNGVAIISKSPPNKIQKGFTNNFDEENSRLIAAEIDGVNIINVYVPNGQDPELPAFEYKRTFFKELRSFLSQNFIKPNQTARSNRTARRIVLCGDFNVAPENEDVFDPDYMRGKICFHPDEQADFEYLKSWGLTDIFRKFHPEGNFYSWWDYRAGGFPRNRGMRLDHFLVSAPIAQACKSCEIDKEPRGWEKPSDHVPVTIDFKM